MPRSIASDFETSVQPAAEAPVDRRTDLRDVFQIIQSRRNFVLVPTAVALVLALLYLAVATRMYTGVVSIIIDARTHPAVGDMTNTDNGSPDAVLVESQVKLITSASVMRRVAEAEHLDQDPEYVSNEPGLRARLMALIGIDATPAQSMDEFTRAGLALAPHVVVKRSERTYIADIEVTSRDPMKSARLANALAKAYLADQQATRNDAAQRDGEWLRQQIGGMQASLQAAEVKVDAYKREHGIVGTNGKLLNEQELADAAAGLTLARARATETKARYDQIQRVINSGRNIDTLPDALKSPAIEKLRTQYADISRQRATLLQTLGSRHPALLEVEHQIQDTRHLIDEELARVQVGIGNEYQTSQANVAALDKQVQSLKSATVLSNESQVKLDELQRDVDARRAVYDRFLQARDTVKEQAADVPIGRVVAPAIAPTAPSSPKTFAILFLALAGGLTTGIGAALLADSFSGRGIGRVSRRAPAEEPAFAVAHDHGGVPVLGYIPSPFGEVARRASRRWLVERMRSAWPTASQEPADPPDPRFMAAIDALDLEALMAPRRSRTGITTLLVTSAGPQDSRSAVAMGIAEAAARDGKRAVVIDADGGGTLLRDLVAPGARPALIDLMGTTRLCYEIMGSSRGSLSIVPMLPDEARMARRLLDRDDVEKIDGIKGNFDLVVFDGPNAGDVDRLHTLAVTVMTLLIVAPPETTRDDLDRVIELLDLPSDHPMVAVIAADLTDDGLSSEAA